MKKSIFLLFAVLLVSTCFSQTKTATKKPVAKKTKPATEMVVTYVSTWTNMMGMVNYTFKNEKDEQIIFGELDPKNPELKKLFEFGNIKESVDEADFTVKENVGKKYTIKYKAVKAKGGGTITWSYTTIYAATELK